MTRRTNTVVVTGASAGVGRATALASARRGWNVALLARGQAGLQTARREVEAAGGRAMTIRADVSDAAAMFAAADRVAREWSGIDVWVNNAMLTVFSPIDEMTPEEFRHVTEVTYLGQVYGAMAALKHMQRQRRGTIVCVGSALSYRGIPLQSAYCGAKFAIRGFFDSLRSELIHKKSPVRITLVQLPAVNTPQFDWARSKLPKRLQPMPPIFQPEAVANAIVRAAEHAPPELWIGRSTWQTIIASMLAPRLFDRWLANKGYSGQQTKEQARTRANNLFGPVDQRRAFGAHGRFDARAATWAGSVDPRWLRNWLVLAAGMAIGTVAYVMSNNRLPRA